MKLRLGLILLLAANSANRAYSQATAGWAGHYIYEEEPVKAVAGYAEVMEWDLTITPKATAVIEINGQQTFFKLLTDVTINGSVITLIYNKTLDGADFGAFKKGQQLLVLKKNAAGKLITQWAVLTPLLSEKYPKECLCFVKK